VHPKAVGDRCLLAFALLAQTLGHQVLLPLGENCRYDLVVDDGEGLKRIQCKAGRLRHGVVSFNTASTYGHHRDRPQRRSYRGEADFFGVYCETTGAVYLVPVSDVPARSQAALRVEPALNNQKAGVRLAADYQFGRVQLIPVEGMAMASASFSQT
jgi:hypothetical protein